MSDLRTGVRLSPVSRGAKVDFCVGLPGPWIANHRGQGGKPMALTHEEEPAQILYGIDGQLSLFDQDKISESQPQAALSCVRQFFMEIR